MDDIFVNGVWRMDWGLGNPNKTAALIAILMVAVWGVAYLRKWGFWVSLVLFSGLGICLVHTFSRGGVVAAFFGLIPLLLVLRRPFPWGRVVAVVVSIWVIVGASIYLQAHERLGRFLYLAGWGTVFLICFPSSETKWLAVPFGIWLAFFTGAVFSSVAESPWLWIIPIFSLVWVIGWRIWERRWFDARLYLLPLGGAAVCLLLLAVTVQGSSIQKNGNAVFVGGSDPDYWVVLDEKVLGKKPGRSLREGLSEHDALTIGVVENVRDLPRKGLSSVVLAGNVPQENRNEALNRLKSAKSVTLLNPLFYPQELPLPDQLTVQVLIGEFSQSPAARSGGFCC